MSGHAGRAVCAPKRWALSSGPMRVTEPISRRQELDVRRTCGLHPRRAAGAAGDSHLPLQAPTWRRPARRWRRGQRRRWGRTSWRPSVKHRSTRARGVSEAVGLARPWAGGGRRSCTARGWSVTRRRVRRRHEAASRGGVTRRYETRRDADDETRRDERRETRRDAANRRRAAVLGGLRTTPRAVSTRSGDRCLCTRGGGRRSEAPEASPRHPRAPDCRLGTAERGPTRRPWKVELQPPEPAASLSMMTSGAVLRKSSARSPLGCRRL
jgi:hypothetical protein